MKESEFKVNGKKFVQYREVYRGGSGSSKPSLLEIHDIDFKFSEISLMRNGIAHEKALQCLAQAMSLLQTGQVEK